MKMFFAMGITWLAEVVAFAIDYGHGGNAAFGSDNNIVNICKIIISLQVGCVSLATNFKSVCKELLQMIEVRILC